MADEVDDDDEIDLTLVDIDELGFSAALPTGWDAELDVEGSGLTVVGDERFADDDYAPSITIERRQAVGGPDDLAALAERSLDEMRVDYDDFELHWSESVDDGQRIVRSYEFDVPELARRVRQVQGLVATDGFLVVNCTSPLSVADLLEPLFKMVIGTLEEH